MLLGIPPTTETLDSEAANVLQSLGARGPPWRPPQPKEKVPASMGPGTEYRISLMTARAQRSGPPECPRHLGDSKMSEFRSLTNPAPLYRRPSTDLRRRLD